MSNTKILHIAVNEDEFERLGKRAGAAGLEIDAYVLRLIEADEANKLVKLEQAVSHIERLIWQNLYWSSLPYSEGPPRQRLSDDGVATLWDNSAIFSDRYASLESVPDESS